MNKYALRALCSVAMTDYQNRTAQRAEAKPRQVRRWVFRIGLAAIVFILTWWGSVRLMAGARAITIVTANSTDSNANDSDTLRIMTWNIAHGRGLSESNFNGESHDARDRRLTAIASVIREHDADIVILNEVDFNSTWSHNINQAAIIAERAGYAYRVEQRNYDTSLPFFSLKFGNVILSSHPIRATQALNFPTISRWKSILAGSKQGVLTTVDVQGIGRLIDVVAVHLESPWGAHDIRTASTQVIRDAIIDADRPGIVAGDFNTSPPGYPGVRAKRVERTALSVLLDDDMMSLHSEMQPTQESMTYRADIPTRLIDWILFTREWKLVSQEVLPTDLSDHRPLIVELRLVK